MAHLLKSASLVALDPPSIERADLRIDGGLIVDRAGELQPREEDEITDLAGKLIMPGMVCAHTHLYSSLARGMPAPPRPPINFKEILELIWWRLDRALDEETIYWSAIAGAMDAARAGTTCLFDHHSSPSRIKGSLEIIGEAVERVGLRAVLCYEISDRGGLKERDQGVEENSEFLQSVKKRSGGLLRGLVGAHASFTLSDETLRMCSAVMADQNAGLHIHVAEDLCDVEETRSRHNAGIIDRLIGFHALNNRTILAHGTHLDRAEIELARNAGARFAHNPRSNMNNRVGYAPVQNFADRLLLGTDGIGADMFEEARSGYFKARDGGVDMGPASWLQALANNQCLASETFGIELGRLNAGAAADLIVLDYNSPTPMTADNLAGHFTFGVASGSVESVMVNGRFIVKNRRSLVDEPHVYDQIQKASRKLWAALDH
jgi:putative selenium metabolism protein SsnA